MQEKPNLRRNALWNASGNAAYAAAQWGMMVVLAKLAGANEVGQFALGLAVTAPIFMLSNLQLRAIQLTDVGDEVDFGEYLGLRLVTVSISLLIVAAYSINKNSETGWVIFAISLSKALEAVSDVIHGFFQRHENSKLVAKSLIIRAIFSILALGFSYYILKNLIYASLSMALSWCCILVFYDLRFASKVTSIKPKFNLYKLHKVLYRAFPLGVSMMFISLQTNVIRYFLERYISSAALGVFSALIYLLMAGSIFINSIGQAASPRLASLWFQNNLRSFIQLVLLLLAIAFAGGLVSIVGAHLFGVKLLTLIYSREFVSSDDLLVVLMFGGLLSYLASVLGYALTAAKIINIQPYLFFVVFLVATACAWYCVPRWGSLGAAWSTVIVSGTQLFGSLALIVYAIRKRR